MNHVTCIDLDWMTNSFDVYRGERMIGRVCEVSGEPALKIFGVQDNPLTFVDMDIIQDNWNQLQEMRGWEERQRKIYKNGVDKVV